LKNSAQTTFSFSPVSFCSPRYLPWLLGQKSVSCDPAHGANASTFNVVFVFVNENQPLNGEINK
jgi:hypothetical protein